MNWPKVVLLALVNCSLGKSIDIFTWCLWAYLPKRNSEPVVPSGSFSYGLTYIFRTTYQTSLFWPITPFQIRVGGESGVPASARLCIVFLVASWTPQMPQAGLGYSIEVWTILSFFLIPILKSSRTQLSHPIYKDINRAIIYASGSSHTYIQQIIKISQHMPGITLI
jgi:hypothetical protein